MTFPEQLKAQRERLGLTQAELASFLDVSSRAVWQWEQGTLPHVLTQEGALARLTKAKLRPFVTMKRLLAILAALALCGCSTNYAGRTYVGWWLSTRQVPSISFHP